MIDAKLNICTLNENNPWFQVKLNEGFAIITGFRLKRTVPEKIKHYKIMGSNDINKPIEKWEELININEKTEDEHKSTDIYLLDHPSLPIKFIRLIQVEPNWSNENFLKFFHFDIFGSYF